MLEVERKYYSEKVEEWKRLYPGKFVVVKGRELVGVFPSMDDALSAGGAKFGLDSFLVRLVGQGEMEVSVPALALGLIGANPPRANRRSGSSA
ncbi:MAG TPA: hypothetical protein VEG25_12945 [Burkholderiales bacterium]|nr:hypothetical protein [Burkholderiales bacterium]